MNPPVNGMLVVATGERLLRCDTCGVERTTPLYMIPYPCERRRGRAGSLCTGMVQCVAIMVRVERVR